VYGESVLCRTTSFAEVFKAPPSIEIEIEIAAAHVYLVCLLVGKLIIFCHLPESLGTRDWCVTRP
jgi:hypothetical protein